jgi:hypothetical protein
MRSLLAFGKITNRRRPKMPTGGLCHGVWRVLIKSIGMLLVSIWVGPQVTHGQSTGSPCIVAPSLAMAGSMTIAGPITRGV